MADIGTIVKKTPKPYRLMGGKSTSIEAPILYYEFGTFTIANAATTGTLPTSLTNVIAVILTPLNIYTRTALAISDLTLTSGKLTITNVDPGNAAGAAYSYFLIGTIETL